MNNFYYDNYQIDPYIAPYTTTKGKVYYGSQFQYKGMKKISFIKAFSYRFDDKVNYSIDAQRAIEKRCSK